MKNDIIASLRLKQSFHADHSVPDVIRVYMQEIENKDESSKEMIIMKKKKMKLKICIKSDEIIFGAYLIPNIFESSASL